VELLGPLTGANPHDWMLVPDVEARIRAFITTFHSDQDPDDLVRTFKAHFVAETGLSPCWLWLADDQICGHLLAWLDASPRRRVLFVGPVWSDVPLAPSFRRAIVTSLEAHGRALHCTALEGWVENPAILRLYRKIGMATPVMTAVRRRLDPLPAEEPSDVLR
jgi:hypothetical protein